MPIAPSDSPEQVIERVREWAPKLGPNEWLVGGIIGSVPLQTIGTSASYIAQLDAASHGHPVMIRDDSQHNRWVNSKALEAMKVTQDTPNPEGGTFVRDPDGKLTGVCWESATTFAETAFRNSIPDKSARYRGAMEAALRTLNSFGVTTIQEAATAIYPAQTIAAMEKEGKLPARIVACAMVREFIEEGVFGEDLIQALSGLRGDLFKPDFVKLFIDGVPITRTAAMLNPYKCLCSHAASDPHEDFRGDSYWTMDDLVKQLRRCYELKMGAKMHCTGDAAVRLVLDAVQVVRNELGQGPQFQVAHAEYIAPEDLNRFKDLDVVADFSPYIWFPSVIQDAIKPHVTDDVINASWPARSFLEAGVNVSAGSDWPCAAPTPDPYTGLQTLVTRRNPDPSVEGTLNAKEAISLEEAIKAFTVNPAKAMGLEGVSGQLKQGCSADFVVLDRNLFEIDVGEIYKAKALKTYFAGKLVYEA